jgi:hypothetical protein
VDYDISIKQETRAKIEEIAEVLLDWANDALYDSFDNAKLRDCEWRDCDGFLSYNYGGRLATVTIGERISSGLYHTAKERAGYDEHQKRCADDFISDYPNGIDDQFYEYKRDYFAEFYSDLSIRVFVGHNNCVIIKVEFKSCGGREEVYYREITTLDFLGLNIGAMMEQLKENWASL